jgi:hypothetical protein
MRTASRTPDTNTPSTHSTKLQTFSSRALSRPLHTYQSLIAGHILRSIACGLGLTFTVMMARQMGKNELSAHLEAYLLELNADAGGSIVKAAPTFRPQITTSMMRLESLLRAPRFKPHWKREHGYTIAFKNARALFFSADPDSEVMGATASLLLEIDEAQDVDPEKYTRDFRPMASSTNATTILWGTSWTDESLLETTKQSNLRLQQLSPDFPRHFEFDWTHGAAENDKYGRFVRAEIGRLGEYHPLIRTQYLLRPLKDAGAFLSKEDLARLQGTHQRRRVPEPEDIVGSYYVAGIDVAGPSEVATDALLRAAHPRKDSTVVTIAKVTPLKEDGSDPLVRIQDLYWWTGRPLHEQCDQLVDLFTHVWPCRKVVVDATGLGADLAARLQVALGKDTVDPFVFTAPAKSRLSYHLLSLVGRSRLHMWSESSPHSPLPLGEGQGEGNTEAHLSPEAAEFWRECRLARPLHRSSGLLSFYVPDHLGHDDFLSSLALLAWSVQPESPQHTTPLTPTQFIYPEPEDVNLLPF